jgi:hypothetical protein
MGDYQPNLESEPMKSITTHLSSPAMAVACLALLVALGGVSYAATVLPANSVSTKHCARGR